MSEKEIREICIKSDFNFNALPNSYEAYRDKLRISKQRISYKRFFFPSDKVSTSWDYKTTSKEYSENYESLCMHIRMISMPEKKVDECGKFEIEIIYTDMTSKVLNYCNDFHFNKLDYIAYLVKKLIPVGESYSGLLDYDDLACLDENLLEESINILSRNPKIEWQKSQSEPGELTFSYPKYEPWVWKIFELLTHDYQYNITIEKIKKSKKKISDFNFEEVKAMLTYIERGERFCDGFIAHLIENGVLLELLRQLKKIYNSK